MGVVANKPFKSNNPKIIDYVNSNLRSDFMDVYLGAKCTFCISTGYGFDELPYIFRRPIAYLTIPFGNLYSYSEKFLLLTKHHILKKEKRRLSLSEIFSYGVAYALDTKIFRQKGIELVDNTPEEIKDTAIEMVENLEFKKKLNHKEVKKKLNHKEEELQKTFKRLFALNAKQTENQHPYPKFHGQIRCRFSTKFLRENKNWLK